MKWVLTRRGLQIEPVKSLPVSTGSDVPAPAWPESPGFGLAFGGLGFVKSQARPKAKISAWLGLALA